MSGLRSSTRCCSEWKGSFLSGHGQSLGGPFSLGVSRRCPVGGPAGGSRVLGLHSRVCVNGILANPAGRRLQFGKPANPANLGNWLRLIQRSAQQMNITTRANRPDVPKSSTTSRATAEMRRRSFERLLVQVRRRGVLRVQRAVARRCRGS